AFRPTSRLAHRARFSFAPDGPSVWYTLGEICVFTGLVEGIHHGHVGPRVVFHLRLVGLVSAPRCCRPGFSPLRIASTSRRSRCCSTRICQVKVLPSGREDVASTCRIASAARRYQVLALSASPRWWCASARNSQSSGIPSLPCTSALS